MADLRSLILASLHRSQWLSDFKGTAEEWENHLRGLSDSDLLDEYDAAHEALHNFRFQ